MKALKDTRTPNGVKVGRRRREPTEAMLSQITQLAAVGHNLNDICYGLNVSRDVFRRWREDFPSIAEAFNHGRERERLAIHGRLYQSAMDGNIVAGIFLLKARHGYREGEQADVGSRVNVTFNMPAAQPLEKYIIENGTDPTRPAVQPVSISGPGGGRRA